MRSHPELDYPAPHGILPMLELRSQLPYFMRLKTARESHEQKIEATSFLRNPGLAGAGQASQRWNGVASSLLHIMKTTVRATAPVCLPDPEIPDLDITAALILSGILEPLFDLPLEQACAEASGLHELLRHHPALKQECSALHSLAEAEQVLCRFTWATNKRFNS